MTSTKTEIAQTASTISGAPSVDEILQVWNGCCQFLESSMDQGKVINYLSLFYL